MSAPVLTATYTAPTNIATIKYWGKRDVKLNLPINSSVSVTLDQDDLHAKTTVTASKSFEKDRLWLNGIEENVATNKRVLTVLKEIRARACTRVAEDGTVIVPAEDWEQYKVHIVSHNTFPTAAGLASSAAGYACLVSALADVFAVKESYPGELTTIARQGSGSASRSLFGGFVRWNMGQNVDGSDSTAVQVASETHWPQLRVLVCVVSDKKKETGSTEGMTTSVNTSELLAHRAANVVPKRLEDIEKAFHERDFDTFGKITMQDSNQFHACCLDTYPPIFYMNDVSKKIISVCHKLNKAYSEEKGVKGSLRVAYTFDAGPNAVLYTLDEHMPTVMAAIAENFAPPESQAAVEDTVARMSQWKQHISQPAFIDDCCTAYQTSPLSDSVRCVADDRWQGISYIYATKMGDGPRKLDNSEALAVFPTGLPLEK